MQFLVINFLVFELHVYWKLIVLLRNGNSQRNIMIYVFVREFNQFLCVCCFVFLERYSFCVRMHVYEPCLDITCLWGIQPDQTPQIKLYGNRNGYRLDSLI